MFEEGGGGFNFNFNMSRCLRKPTEGGAVDAESFGFPKLSLFSAAAAALSLSTIQPRSCFTPLPFFMIISGGCVVDARPKILMSETRLELAVALRKLCVKRETSNLSEVCSGSDCYDNNMGSLTKWNKNPAQVRPRPVRVFS